MALTFQALVTLLTPDDSQVITLVGSDLDDGTAAALFDACFTGGTLTLSDATMQQDAATQTVTVGGTVAANSVLGASAATVTGATFAIAAGGDLAMALPIAIPDSAQWQLSTGFPMLGQTVLSQPGWLDTVVTLQLPVASAFPPGCREYLGLPADLPVVAAALVSGLSIATTIAMPKSGALALLGVLMPSGLAFAGPVEMVSAPYGANQTPAPFPQILLTGPSFTPSSGVGDYDLTFTSYLVAGLSEIGTDTDQQLADIGFIALGGVALTAQFTPSGSSTIAPFEITAALTSGSIPQLVFTASSLPTGTFQVSDLAGMLGNTPVDDTLSPGGDSSFAVSGGLTLVEALLTLDFSGATPSFSRMQVSVGYVPDSPWSCFDGFICFEKIVVTAGVIDSGSGFSPWATVDCAAYLDGNPSVQLDATVSYPDLTFSLKLETDVQSPPTLDLLSSMSTVLDSNTATPLLSATGTSFSLAGNIPGKQYSFSAAIEENWTLVGDLALTGLLLDLAYDGSATPSGSGTITAQLTLAEVPISVSASYEGGSWTFIGSSSPGQSVNLTDLLTELAGYFKITLPSGLPSVTIDQLQATYVYPAGTFNLSAIVGFSGADVNLANLPLVGELVGPDFQIGVQSIDFTADIASASNNISLSVVLSVGTAGTQTVVVPISTAGAEAAVKAPGTAQALVAAATPGSYPPQGNAAWVNIGRSFGPVSIEKIGFGLNGGNIEALLNASLSFTGLDVAVQGLNASFPLDEPSQITFGIEGLAVSYDSPTLSIGGGLLETGSDPLTFQGSLMVKAEALSLSAFGSFTGPNGAIPPSMFAYLVLNDAIGGPPAFFVTGLAAGFGINTQINLPAINGVAAFPLVQAAQDAGYWGANPSLETVQSGLAQAITDQTGEYWLAAGIAFSSFDVVQSFALLTVEFGTEFQIALLGESTLSLPVGSDSPVILAQMVLEALYKPSDGVFSVAAQLTTASHILDPSCHLTGGFAFYIWFDPSPQAGQFVVTLGGYNPHFTPPPYYPTVPALGIDWQVSDALSIKGGAYTALTPSCIMAGGSLAAVWQSGDIRAWFTLYADFLAQWAPFYYQIDAGVDFGVQATVRVLGVSVTLSVDVGADLFISGPPFSGYAQIHLSVLTFQVSFGDPPAQPTLTWGGFKSQFLNASVSAAPKLAEVTDTDTTVPAPTPTPVVVKVVLANGLLTDLTNVLDPENQSYPVQYIVDPYTLAISVTTLIPIADLTFNGATQSGGWATSIGLGAMGLSSFDNSFAITVMQGDSGDQQIYSLAAADTGTLGGVPNALWGQPGADQDLTSPSLLADALMTVGVVSSVPQPAEVQPIKITSLLDEVGASYPLVWDDDPAPASDPWDGDDPITKLTETVAATSASAARFGAFAHLLSQGMPLGSTIKVDPLTRTDTLGFIVPFMLRSLGEAKPSLTS